MKKNLYFICLIIFMCVLLCGCKKEETVDYSEYSFVDVYWTRDTEFDTEYISFSSDGYYSYSCACGNPVNDSDICETYTFDEETNQIKINCPEKSHQTITNIKIISCDENNLKLDFNGEIRTFKKEQN